MLLFLNFFASRTLVSHIRCEKLKNHRKFKENIVCTAAGREITEISFTRPTLIVENSRVDQCDSCENQQQNQL